VALILFGVVAGTAGAFAGFRFGSASVWVFKLPNHLCLNFLLGVEFVLCVGETGTEFGDSCEDKL
jgi:hypothetical protein